MTIMTENSAKPVLYGAAYSVYVRIVRLMLLESEVDYRLEEIDIFAASGPGTEQIRRHPFGKIPAFSDGKFHIYETSAINGFIDRKYNKNQARNQILIPDDAESFARMLQAISICDHYAYPDMIWGLYVPWESNPDAPLSKESDPVWERCENCLAALETLAAKERFLSGGRFSLADIHAAPMFHYFLQIPTAKKRIKNYPRLETWWRTHAQRPGWKTLLDSR